jgi:hypothetical protein
VIVFGLDQVTDQGVLAANAYVGWTPLPAGNGDWEEQGLAESG